MLNTAESFEYSDFVLSAEDNEDIVKAEILRIVRGGLPGAELERQLEDLRMRFCSGCEHATEQPCDVDFTLCAEMLVEGRGYEHRIAKLERQLSEAREAATATQLQLERVCQELRQMRHETSRLHAGPVEIVGPGGERQ